MNRCPGCSRAGDDVGKCGRRVTCPVLNGQEAPEVDPKKDALIRCNRCDITRAITVQSVMNPSGGQKLEMEHHCPLGADSCQAFLVGAPKEAPAKKGKVDA